MTNLTNSTVVSVVMVTDSPVPTDQCFDSPVVSGQFFDSHVVTVTTVTDSPVVSGQCSGILSAWWGWWEAT